MSVEQAPEIALAAPIYPDRDDSRLRRRMPVLPAETDRSQTGRDARGDLEKDRRRHAGARHHLSPVPPERGPHRQAPSGDSQVHQGRSDRARRDQHERKPPRRETRRRSHRSGDRPRPLQHRRVLERNLRRVPRRARLPERRRQRQPVHRSRQAGPAGAS